MAISKVVYGGDTLMDITDSTVSENNLLDGIVAYGADGERVVGGVRLATKLSELENDVGYVTGDVIKVSSTEPDSDQTKVWIKDSDNEEVEVLTPNDLEGYAKSTDIPTKTSQLTNDSGFLTGHQYLDNYYTKTEIDNKGYIISSDDGIAGQILSTNGDGTVQWIDKPSEVTDDHINELIDAKTINFLTLDTLPKYDGGVR